MEKALIGSVAPATLDEMRPFIEAALQHEPSGTMCVDDFAGMHLFKGLDGNGAVIGGYALAVASWKQKKVVWVMAAASNDPTLDMIRSYMPVILQQAKALGGHQLALVTVRKGLARRMRKAGLVDGGTVFRLDLE